MRYSYGLLVKMLRGPMRIFVVILLLVFLSHVLGSDHAQEPPESRKVSKQEAMQKNFAERVASDHSMGNFEPSLETKENTDFLLTPAFLVQEALSDNIVLTYPVE